MSMKNTVFAVVASIAISICGCKCRPKIHVIENKTVVTNSVPVKAFNNENYIWEDFYFSTNQVQNIRQGQTK